jgi:hypothetical protein
VRTTKTALTTDRSPPVQLLSTWTLDSAGKFAAACAGTLALGLLLQYLTLRRVGLARRRRSASLAAQTLVLYFLQTVLSYLLMLVAMTYSAELFVSMAAGLTLGYALFHLHRPGMPPPEQTEACCAMMQPTDTDTDTDTVTTDTTKHALRAQSTHTDTTAVVPRMPVDVDPIAPGGAPASGHRPQPLFAGPAVQDQP